MFNPLGTGFFYCVLKEIRACYQHNGKTGERIFIKFSAMVGHDSRFFYFMDPC